jgi:hypothetical protein
LNPESSKDMSRLNPTDCSKMTGASGLNFDELF